ncbi:archease [Candidatus Falkowbacteria bacterium]|nr:archease [Candidatus Falkowbacteria bacterium]
MKKYEILEHTTDLKIRAFGKTKEELFLNMLKGMFESVKPKILTTPSPSLKRRGIRTRKINIKSADEQSLLVDFLSEALTLSDINNEAYFEVEFEKLTETELEAEIFGAPVKSFSTEIKAVTYHGLEIKKTDGGWEATVLFDI